MAEISYGWMDGSNSFQWIGVIGCVSGKEGIVGLDAGLGS